MAKKKPRFPKDHPALVPKLAWQEVIQHLMAVHDFKKQYKFANKIDVTEQTVSRWLGKSPAMPDPLSFEKVADSFEMPRSQLQSMWLSFMNRHDPYPQGPAAASEVAETSAVYGAPDVVAQAEALSKLGLDAVPLEQRPFLHQLRRHISDLASHHDESTKRNVALISRLIACFHLLFQSAIDTGRKMGPTQSR